MTSSNTDSANAACASSAPADADRRVDGMSFETALLHARRRDPFAAESTTPPIFQTSAYLFDEEERHAAVAGGRAPGYVYSRLGNPTVAAFERRMAALEGGFAAVATASGMAAIFNALINVLRCGDKILAGANLYGGSVELFDNLEVFGIETVYVPEVTPEALSAAWDERCRVVFAETISNPCLDVLDIPAVAAWAHERGLGLIVDNTVATPYLCRPLALGADVVVESSSKFINGHSNAISGVVVDSGRGPWSADKFPSMKKWARLGQMAYVAKLRQGLFRDTGACLAPLNAFLNCTGIETLALRMERACSNALKLAEWFEQSGLVSEVRYPGLASSPARALAERQFGGRGFGALVAVRVGSRERAFEVIDAVKIPLRVSNIGDTKTLITHPASTVFADNTDEERAAAGVWPDTIRLSIGIEDVSDLICDFKQALEGARS